MTNDVPAYRIRSLIHSYNGSVVLEIPRLDIPAGRVCAFVGPNGSGKTTLLSILALLIAPSSGSVLLDGVETTRNHKFRPELRRKLTLVHQKPFLFSTTVRNNLRYGLKSQGAGSTEINKRVEAIAGASNLSGLLDKPARALSGGEAQRAVLARALVLETPILILDEPTNSLDSISKPIFIDLLHEAHQRRNTTIVMATHDLEFISAFSGLVFCLEEGKITAARDT
ncbi:MAG TPA: energy-coupling factor ABC transporter ATP-binding protein [Acidobacteriota bacterium]|nr:energy-coupling factor ABC transporter ATP-binding protein [Acidobacteriota bacterium]